MHMPSPAFFPQNSYSEHSAPRLNTTPKATPHRHPHLHSHPHSMQQQPQQQIYSPYSQHGFNLNFFRPAPCFNAPAQPHVCNNTHMADVISVCGCNCLMIDPWNGRPAYFPYYMAPDAHLTSPISSENSSHYGTYAANNQENRPPVIVSSSPTVALPQWDCEVHLKTNVGQHQGINVHIGKLKEDTTDEQLLKMVSNFGRVISSKAIIDRPNGICKGFGFALFHTLAEAERCMQGLREQGFETSIAKESFNGKLKERGDPDSTNLYVSNLPTFWSQNDVLKRFGGFEIESIKLLGDGNGKFRGVAFVRFDTRGTCDKVIDVFNCLDLKVQNHNLPLQVRYADTVAQKDLKKAQKSRVMNTSYAQPLHHANKVWKNSNGSSTKAGNSTPPASPSMSNVSSVPPLTCNTSVCSGSSVKGDGDV